MAMEAFPLGRTSATVQVTPKATPPPKESARRGAQATACSYSGNSASARGSHLLQRQQAACLSAEAVKHARAVGEMVSMEQGLGAGVNVVVLAEQLSLGRQRQSRVDVGVIGR